MKLLTAQQIHQWDAYTIEHAPIPSIDLMERAARKCTDFIIGQMFTAHPVKIFCGKGNNGGDGLAIARQLIREGFHPHIYILEFGAKGTEDFQINLHRLHQLTTNINFIQSKEFFPEINKNDIVIDALFGSGLNRPLEYLSSDIVECINQSGTTILSIDVPSGMYIDKSSKGNAVIKATRTLTFQSLKLCFLVAENADHFGEVTVLDIGLDENFPETVDTAFEMVSPSLVSSFIKPRKPFSHKGNFGHALLVAGNKGKMGAAVLASKACLRTGAGLLTVNVPGEFLSVIHTAIPEAMCITRDDEADRNKFTAIGIGPGLGTVDDAVQLVQKVLHEFHRPMVLDADALNIISANKEWLGGLPQGSVITPHPREFERLFGRTENDFERIYLATELSRQYPFIIILKGHYTLIAERGKGWFNTSGNSGMAKGGSGDVLTGILTSFFAQGYTSLEAAITGTYLHGLAGDIALQYQSPESLFPSDIIENIGNAFSQLSKNKKEVQE